MGELRSAARVLQEYAVSHWDGPPAPLQEIPVFAAVVLGDVARAARRVIEEDDPDGAEREAGRELGNLVLSSLRWMEDLGLEVTDCLEAAARSQAEYGQRSSGGP